MNVLSALLSSVNLRFSVGIAMFLLLCHTVPAADAFSREQVATTYALARPVLRDGASDAALIEHLKSLGGQGQSNIINVLYLVFRESIKERGQEVLAHEAQTV